jgi:hypothetical protein
MKTKLHVPIEPLMLAPWLLVDPAERLKALRRLISTSDRVSFGYRRASVKLGLEEAWDARPFEFYEQLEPWFSSSNARLKGLVASCLSENTEELRHVAVGWLQELAADSSRDVRLYAIERLCERADMSRDERARYAVDRDPRAREAVARSLALAPDLEAVVPVLEALCVDRNGDVHTAAVATLLKLYERDEGVAKSCAQLMAMSDDTNVRWAVTVGYYQPLLAENFERFMPTLRPWLRSSERNLHWTLAHALRLAPLTPLFLSVLRSLFEVKDALIRRRVLWLLERREGMVDPAEVEGVLRAAAQDTSRRVREQATRTAAALSRSRAQVVEPLTGLGDDQSEVESED